MMLFSGQGLPNCDPPIKEIKSPDGRVETLALQMIQVVDLMKLQR